MRPPKRAMASAFVFGSMLITTVSCGSDSVEPSGSERTSVTITRSSDLGGDSGESASANQSSADSSGSLADALGASDALDSVGIGTIAFALATALKADRHEIDGNTVHLYLNDGSSLRGDTACIVTDSILGEGQFAVIHDDGEEFVC